MHASRDQFLTCAGPCDHAARLYADDASLIDSLEVFAESAFARGESLVLIATAEHAKMLTERLQRNGRDCGAMMAAKQFLVIDATETLAEIMDGDHPDRAHFESVVRPVITDCMARFRGVAVFGELVDLLWQRGNRAAAHALEEWWNELIAVYGCTLLCGYRIDVFDFRDGIQQDIETICSTHTHLLPVAEYDRLESAVDAAMRQVFCNGDADALKRHLADRRSRATLMPPAQAALLSLRDLLPTLAQEVRLVARDHYIKAKATAS